MALAGEMVKKSPDAVRAAKHLYDQMWVSDDVAAALVLETELQAALIGS